MWIDGRPTRSLPGPRPASASPSLRLGRQFRAHLQDAGRWQGEVWQTPVDLLHPGVGHEGWFRAYCHGVPERGYSGRGIEGWGGQDDRQLRHAPRLGAVPRHPRRAQLFSDDDLRARAGLWDLGQPHRDRRHRPLRAEGLPGGRFAGERPGSLWTVFDPEGRVLGFVETPEGLRIWEIGEDYILGRADDGLGVESVQVWPLERSGG